MRIYPGTTLDSEFKALGDLGYTGTLNDRQFSVLRDQGLTLALPDMFGQFYDGGGLIIPLSVPLTYRSTNAIGVGSYANFSQQAVGPASYDRWVVMGVAINYNAGRELTYVSIGGDEATLLYASPDPLATSGGRIEFWKAYVPLGTVADVFIRANGSFFDGIFTLWSCEAEPVLHDSAEDLVSASSVFALNIDVPEGGSVAVMANNSAGGDVSSVSGFTQDTYNATYRIVSGSEDELAAETGRALSATFLGTSPNAAYDSMAAISTSFGNFDPPDNFLGFSGWGKVGGGASPRDQTVNIGIEDPNRWVIIGVLSNFNTGRSLTGVTINGVSATLLYAIPPLTTEGTGYEFWKANVPTGTSVTVSVTSAGSFYGTVCGSWVSLFEPTLHDSAYDDAGSGNFSVTIDVPEDGAIIAMANTTAGIESSWTGMDQAFFNVVDVCFGGSISNLPAETGRTVSMSFTAGAAVTAFDGMAVISLSF